MRTLAIGDIHGSSSALDALLDVVQPTADDHLVFLGDYVSRGPDTRGVLDRLINLLTRHRITCLRGNHEIMMSAARTSRDDLRNWCRVGGQNALDSYAQPGRAGRLEDVPSAHWHFLDHQLHPYFETDTHIFVHANLDPGVDLGRQSDMELYWEFLNSPVKHKSGKIMVCGHTNQRNGIPLAWPTSYCIDTGAYAGGWLTCLDVDRKSYWQANNLGRTREDNLSIIDA